jgi:hypothetical protein
VPFLDDKILDAALDDDRVSFSLVDQRQNCRTMDNPRASIREDHLRPVAAN